MDTTVKFPIEAVLYHAHKGLACRLNLHSETQNFITGKIFFPDKKCTESLEEGIVVIDSVVEKENYGFFTGKMKTYESPSDADLIEHLLGINNGDAVDYTLRTFSGKYGTIVGVWNIYHARYTYFAKGVNKPVVEIPSDIINKMELTTIRVTTVYDLICGQNLGCDFKAMKNRIVLPRLLPVYDSTEYRKMLPALLESAIDTDVFEAYEYQGGCYLTPKTLINLAIYFSEEEIVEIVNAANKINQEFDKKLNSLTKRGKLPADVIQRVERSRNILSL